MNFHLEGIQTLKGSDGFVSMCIKRGKTQLLLFPSSLLVRRIGLLSLLWKVPMKYQIISRNNSAGMQFRISFLDSNCSRHYGDSSHLMNCRLTGIFPCPIPLQLPFQVQVSPFSYIVLQTRCLLPNLLPKLSQAQVSVQRYNSISSILLNFIYWYFWYSILGRMLVRSMINKIFNKYLI